MHGDRPRGSSAPGISVHFPIFYLLSLQLISFSFSFSFFEISSMRLPNFFLFFLTNKKKILKTTSFHKETFHSVETPKNNPPSRKIFSKIKGTGTGTIAQEAKGTERKAETRLREPRREPTTIHEVGTPSSSPFPSLYVYSPIVFTLLFFSSI